MSDIDTPATAAPAAVSAPPFDARELRRVLGAFVTGVTVITTLDGDGRPHGLTANSFSSVSLDPPLILWSQSTHAPSHPVFVAAERFAVNILADDQIDLSNRFARGGADKFAGCAVDAGIGGVPLIRGCAAHLECCRVSSFAGGDHVVFVGRVDRIEQMRRPPLVFGGGRYLVAQPHDIGPAPVQPPSANIAHLKAVRLGMRAIAELSDELDETLGLGVWGNRGPTMVRWEEASRPVSDNLRTGLVLPVLTSATGLALAAGLPREVTAALIEAELAEPDGPAQHLDPASIGPLLDAIRRAGHAVLEGTARFAELYGGVISAVSVPVCDASGAAVMALTAIGSIDRLDTRATGRLVTALQRCAGELGAHLHRVGSAPVAAG